MRDFNLTHIPDLTERYPEGFGGIDMYAGYDPEYEFWRVVEEAEKCEEEIKYKETKRFKVGEEYESVCWFSGGIGYYTVKAKDDESVTFSIGRHELDGDHDCKDETYKLKYDDDGNEYITLYEYHGEENNIRAGYDGYGNEIY